MKHPVHSVVKLPPGIPAPKFHFFQTFRYLPSGKLTIIGIEYIDPMTALGEQNHSSGWIYRVSHVYHMTPKQVIEHGIGIDITECFFERELEAIQRENREDAA